MNPVPLPLDRDYRFIPPKLPKLLADATVFEAFELVVTEEDIRLGDGVTPGGKVMSPGAGARAASLLDYLTSPSPTDDDKAIRAMIERGGGIVPFRPEPWRLNQRHTLPSGCKLYFQGNPILKYVGPDVGGVGIEVAGVFEIEQGATDVEFGTLDGGQVTIESATSKSGLYAVLGRNISRVRIRGVMGHNINQFLCTSPATTWATTDLDTNCNQDIEVRGGGARFDVIPTFGEGACNLSYVRRGRVTGGTYRNVSHGVRWWGGDSNPDGDGRLTNERKCTDIVIHDCHVDGAIAGGIWGSMGQRIRVSDCTVADAHDVGLDAEGCFDTDFDGCFVRDCRNGNMTTFYFSKNVVFNRCTSVQKLRDAPTFRVYNSTQDADNRDVTVSNCILECTDPTGMGFFDTAFGPVQTLNVRGNTFINVAPVIQALNLNKVYIENNLFYFSRAAPEAFKVLRLSGLVSTRGPSSAIISGNTVRSDVTQPAGTLWLDALVGDPVATPYIEVSDNTVEMGAGAHWANLRIEHVGRTAGFTLNANVLDNVMDGEITYRDKDALLPMRFTQRGNITRGGTNVTVTEIDPT